MQKYHLKGGENLQTNPKSTSSLRSIHFPPSTHLVHSQSSWQPAPRLLLCPERSEGCLVSFQRRTSPPKPSAPENTFPGVRRAAEPPFQRRPQHKRRPPTGVSCLQRQPLLWGRSARPFQGRAASAVFAGGPSNAGTPPGQAPGPGGGQAIFVLFSLFAPFAPLRFLYSLRFFPFAFPMPRDSIPPSGDARWVRGGARATTTGGQ